MTCYQIIFQTASGDVEIGHLETAAEPPDWRLEMYARRQCPKGARVLDILPPRAEAKPEENRPYVGFVLCADGGVGGAGPWQARNPAEFARVVEQENGALDFVRIEELGRLQRAYAFFVEVSYGKGKDRATETHDFEATCQEAAAVRVEETGLFEKPEPRIEAIYQHGKKRRPWKPKPLKPTWRLHPPESLPGARGAPTFNVPYSWRDPDTGALQTGLCAVMAETAAKAARRLRESSALTRLPQARAYSPEPAKVATQDEARNAWRAGRLETVYTPDELEA